MAEQTFEPRIIPFVIDDDPDDEPQAQPGVPPKGEPVSKIDGGPPITYAQVQPQIEAAVAAESKQRKTLRVLAFVNTRRQGSLALQVGVRR
jgi:hypothetical protein